MKKIIVLITCLFSVAYGHGGRTNSEGCHNDRKNGGYHCHNSGRTQSKELETIVVSNEATNKNNKISEISCKVVAVTDGDTIKCLTDKKKQIKVRLDQIDAPESKQDFGTRSKQALSDMIFNKSVTIKSSGLDRYQRTLGTIYSDNVDINLEMVNAGMAWVYVQYAKDQAYFDAEKQAKADKKGLWADKNPVAPWEWRKNKK